MATKSTERKGLDSRLRGNDKTNIPQNPVSAGGLTSGPGAAPITSAPGFLKTKRALTTEGTEKIQLDSRLCGNDKTGICLWRQIGDNDDEKEAEGNKGLTFAKEHKCRKCNGRNLLCSEYTANEQQNRRTGKGGGYAKNR
jgi:hypothetical protein